MEYLEAVDEKWRFLAHRSLTPLEWAFAEALETAAIPLGAVLEGMCRSFERFRPQPGRPCIRTFLYCMGTIVDTALELYPDSYWEARRSTPSPPERDAEKGALLLTSSPLHASIPLASPRPKVVGTE